MKLILLSLMFLLMKWEPICGKKVRTFCVRNNFGSRHCPSDRWVKWSNLHKYLKSNIKLLFPPLVFNLDEVVILSRIENLILTGMEPSTFTINCNATKHEASFIINRATFIQISNVKFRNCGANVIPYTVNNSFSEAYAALLLVNTTSVTISNVSFENSYGHAVIGINMLGYSKFRNVQIYHINGVNGRANDSTNTFVGGFLLLVYDTSTGRGKDFKNTLVIEKCSVFNIQQEMVFTLFHISRTILNHPQ